MSPSLFDDRNFWEQEDALTKEEVLKARDGLWHTITVCVVVSQTKESFWEAQCSCKWAEMAPDYVTARKAGNQHLKEQQ